jgi:hypothetical protein
MGRGKPLKGIDSGLFDSNSQVGGAPQQIWIRSLGDTYKLYISFFDVLDWVHER